LICERIGCIMMRRGAVFSTSARSESSKANSTVTGRAPPARH
jgi:hypothetical protein